MGVSKVRDQKQRRRSLEGSGRGRGCLGASKMGGDAGAWQRAELGEGVCKISTGRVRPIYCEKCSRSAVSATTGRTRANASGPPQIRPKYELTLECAGLPDHWSFGMTMAYGSLRWLEVCQMLSEQSARGWRLLEAPVEDALSIQIDNNELFTVWLAQTRKIHLYWSVGNSKTEVNKSNK